MHSKTIIYYGKITKFRSFKGEKSHQHVSIIHVKVEEEQEGDAEAEEGEHGSFSETPHLVHGLPH